MGVQLCATCQKMVRSETGAAGVMFSLDTESGFDKVVFVTSAWGLGETVVGGTVNPDEWYVFKPTLAEGKTAIVSRTMGSKKCKMVYIKGGGTELVDTKPEEQDKWSLVDSQVEDLAVMAVKIEKHYGRPMDIEWARDGDDGKLYIAQAPGDRGLAEEGRRHRGLQAARATPPSSLASWAFRSSLAAATPRRSSHPATSALSPAPGATPAGSTRAS